MEDFTIVNKNSKKIKHKENNKAFHKYEFKVDIIDQFSSNFF